MEKKMVETFKVCEKYPDITGDNAENFRDELIAIISTVDDDLLIDLSGIGQISSIGISTLFTIYNEQKEHGRKLTVIHACEKNMKLFEMMNMTKIMGK